MDNPYILPLSFITFLPALAALVIGFLPGGAKTPIRWITFGATVAVFIATLIMAAGGETWGFKTDVAKMQDLFSVSWIKSFNINYLMGADGISFPLVILTSFVSMLAMGA